MISVIVFLHYVSFTNTWVLKYLLIICFVIKEIILATTHVMKTGGVYFDIKIGPVVIWVG